MNSELEKLRRMLRDSERERLILDSVRIENKKLRIKLKKANEHIENVNKLDNDNQAPT